MMARCFLVWLLACLCAFGLEPWEVVVVYNSDSALSRNAAELYRATRAIPRNNCLPLRGLGTGEDISREEFDQKVRRELLVQGRALGLMWPSGPRNGRQLVRAMALMPDLPLRVGGVPEQANSVAGLDSELMLLGAEYPLAGPGRNPLLGKVAPRGREEQKILSVCRIDAPDEASVYRMINDPLQVGKTGLWGWVVVDEGGPYAEGDKMFQAAARLAKGRGQPLFHETSRKTLADSFPLMGRTAVYFGWYANPANGPFKPSAPQRFRFAPGAIAFHLHSFSATSLNDNTRWVGALLQRGAAVTAGNVAEPYLGGCINYAVLYERLLAGDALGEAALSATPCVSWMGIVLGDPLYRPFPARPAAVPALNPFCQWQRWVAEAKGDLKALQYKVEEQSGGANGALFAEMFAWHCSECGNPGLATRYFDLAARRYVDRADRTRAALLSIAAKAAAGERADAEFSARKLLESSAGSPYLPAIEETARAVMPDPAR